MKTITNWTSVKGAKLIVRAFYHGSRGRRLYPGCPLYYFSSFLSMDNDALVSAKRIIIRKLFPSDSVYTFLRIRYTIGHFRVAFYLCFKTSPGDITSYSYRLQPVKKVCLPYPKISGKYISQSIF